MYYTHAYAFVWSEFNPTHILADSQMIEDRKGAISELWAALRETIHLRSMALAVAREIHTFDRDSVDVKERIQACSSVGRASL